MLAYKYRFHGHGSLRYVFKNGRTIRSRFIVVRYLENPRRQHSRLAVIVSKKVHKRAVRRNRIRRRVYEIVRHNLSQHAQVYDIAIIITSPETDSMSHQDLSQHIFGLLHDAGIYKSPL